MREREYSGCSHEFEPVTAVLLFLNIVHESFGRYLIVKQVTEEAFKFRLTDRTGGREGEEMGVSTNCRKANQLSDKKIRFLQTGLAF